MFFLPVMCLITSACSCMICVIVAVNPSDGSGVAFGILWDLSWSAMNHWATADQLAKESGCFTLRPSKLLLVEPLHSCERNKTRTSKSGKILYSHPWWMFFFPHAIVFFQESARFFPIWNALPVLRVWNWVRLETASETQRPGWRYALRS